MTWSECYDAVENLDYYIERSHKYPYKSIAELHQEKIAKAEKEFLDRLREESERYKPSREERLLDEISDLKDEASKINDQLKDLKDKLDR